MRRTGVETLEERVLLASQSVPLGDLQFRGEFTEADGIFSASGVAAPIELGLKPTDGEGFKPLVTIDTSVSFVGDVTLNTNWSFTVSGTLDSASSLNAFTLWTGLSDVDFVGVDLADVTHGFAPPHTGQIIDIDSGSIEFTSGNLRFANPDGGVTSDAQIQLQGSLNIPALGNVSGFVGENNFVIVDENGVDGLDAMFNETFSVADVGFAFEDLSINYTDSAQEVAIRGQSSFSLDGSSVKVALGDASTAGLVIQRGEVQQFDMSVTGDINVLGLEIVPKGLTMTYDVGTSQSPEQFEMFGSLNVSTTSNEVLFNVTGTFGTESSPGLVITNGSLTALDITVTGEFDLFGLTITPNDVRVRYNNSTGLLQITTASKDGITVKELFSATATLPELDEQMGGIFIDTGSGHVIVQDLIIQLTDVKLGAFTVKDLEVDYVQTGTVTDFDVKLDLSFPQGWEVQAEVDFVDHAIREISFKWTAEDQKGRIAIGDSGLFLTEMDATVQNLDKPQNLTVSGNLAAEFGDEVSIFSQQQLTFFRVQGGFFVDKDQLALTADVWLGADFDKTTGKTTGVLGTGKGDLALNWNNEVYSLDVHSTLLDGVFTFDEQFQFDGSQDLLITAKADVNVPHGIPLIGGKSLGELDFLLKYEPPDTTGGQADGFVAAWTKIDLFFTKVEAGVEYDFVKNRAKTIGSGTINALKKDADNTSYVYSQLFEVPEGATQATLAVDWSRTFPTNVSGNPVTGKLTVEGDGISDIPESSFCPSDDTECAANVFLISDLSSGTQKQAGLVGSSENSVDAQYVALPVPPGSNYRLKVEFDNPGTEPVNAPVTISTITRAAGEDTTLLAFQPGTPPDLRVGDTMTVAGVQGAGSVYNGDHVVVDITNDGVITDCPYQMDAFGGMMSGWTLPQFSASFHIPQPTVSVNQPTPKTSTKILTVEIPVIVTDLFIGDTSVDVYVDLFNPALGVNQAFNGSLVQKDLTLDPSAPANGDSRNSQTVTASFDISQLLPFQYYIYAVINDGTNTPVTSMVVIDEADPNQPFQPVFEPEFAVQGNVSNQKQEALAGWTVFVDVNQDGMLDDGDLSMITNDQGDYGFFNDPPFPTGPVDLVAQLFSDDFECGADNCVKTITYAGVALKENFTITEKSTIKGTVFHDLDQSGMLPDQDGASGWTVFLDTNRNGRLDPGETSRATGPDGSYSFSQQPAGVYTVALAAMNGAATSYTFDKQYVQGNSIFDSSGNPNMLAHLGTLVGGAQVGTAADFGIEPRPSTDADSNQVLMLAGKNSGQFVDVPHRSDLEPGTGEFSFAAWIRVDDPTVAQDIAGLNDPSGANDGWAVRISHDGQTFARLSVVLREIGSNLELEMGAGPELQANTWYHVAFTYDPTVTDGSGHVTADAVKIYVNGVLQSNTTVLANTLPVGTPDISAESEVDFNVGARGSTDGLSGLLFGGYLDDASVWDTALTPLQIQALAGGGTAPSYVQTAPVMPPTYAVTIDNSGTDVQDGLNYGVLDTATISGVIEENAANSNAPLADWTVKLVSDNGLAAYTTQSTADGSYIFDGVMPGNYSIEQIVPAGWRQTSPFHSHVQFQEMPTGLLAGHVSVAAADFDGDGHVDLSLLGTDVLTIQYGMGDGRFADPTNLNLSFTDAFKVVTADVNGDGHTDIAVIDFQGIVDVLINQGGADRSSLFVNHPAYWKSGPMGPFTDMIAGDFDNDDMDDMAVAWNNQNGLVLDILLSNNQSIARKVFSAGLSGSLAAGDFNRDGNLDLLMADSPGDTDGGALFYGDGTGKLNSKQILTNTNLWPGSVAAGDMNEDGFLDALFQIDLGIVKSVGILGSFQDAAGNLPSSFQLTPNPPSLAQPLILGDFDGDLKLDVAATLDDSTNLNVFVNEGGLNGVWLNASTQPVSIPAGDFRAVNMISADVNGDFLLDLILIGATGTKVLVNQSTKDQGIPVNALAGQALTGNDFTNVQLEQVNGAVFADLNGNGRQEAGDIGLEGVTVYVDRNGNGAFEPDLDLFTTTIAAGAYSFADLHDGEHRIRIHQFPGWLPTGPEDGFHEVTIVGGAEIAAGVFYDFFVGANRPPLIETYGIVSGNIEGEESTLNASFTDLDSLAFSHVASVDWGDGTVSPATVSQSNGVGQVSAKHVYVDGGLYEVTLIVTDGADDTVFRISDPLTVTVTGAGIHDGTLQVIGTNGNDQIAFTQNGDRLRVIASFLPENAKVFDADDFNVVQVFPVAGDDQISTNGFVMIPISVNGDATINRQPAVRMEAVFPDPLIGSVESIEIDFDQSIVGFGVEDLTLTRGSSGNLLASDATLFSDDGIVWTLGNLGVITQRPGKYALTLDSTRSGITNSAGVALANDATEIWENVVPLGDANFDGVFNAADIARVLTSGKYSTGESVNWDEGDWDGNGVFDQFDIVKALRTGNYAPFAFASYRHGPNSFVAHADGDENIETVLDTRSADVCAVDDIFSRAG